MAGTDPRHRAVPHASIVDLIDRIPEAVMPHIVAAEQRIAARIDAMGWRVGVLEAQGIEYRAFRDSFADEDGPISGKAIVKRLKAVEATLSAYRTVTNMGRGALIAGSFLLLLLAKGAWEGLEWVVKIFKG